MNLCGIITEYNPFHNGHIYHIKEAKRLTNPDGLIAIMSGNFCQRGEISVIDKFAKTEAALKNGVNLVIELPFAFTIQNASIFGQKSVEILKLLGINYLVFGSETNNIEELNTIANSSINVDYLKEIMKTGVSYPKAYGLLNGSLYPNDILAISYLKAISNSDIKPISIQRTNEYHSIDINSISSATAIRKALKNNDESYKVATPLIVDDPHFNDELYPYLRNVLLLSDIEELRNYHLVNEGIEKSFKDSAFKYNNYDDFINSLTSKRYTKARIQRTLISIMTHTTKKEIEDAKNTLYARVLGFDDIGRKILHELNHDDVPIISNFKTIPVEHRILEWKSSLLYSSLFSEEKRQLLLKKELQGPIRL